jgi:hypothetical protein
MYDSHDAKREDRMGRFIEGADRRQATLLPETLEDYVGEDNPVRVMRGSKILRDGTQRLAPDDLEDD